MEQYSISRFAIKNFSYLHKPKRKGKIDKSSLIKILPKFPVIVEAGAHIGLDTIEMAKLWPEGCIYAFEPIKALFSQLVENTKNYPNIICQQMALGNYNGKSIIHVGSGASDASSSLLKPKDHLVYHPQVAFTETENINVITLDSWVQYNGIDHIDFLWLDIQGLELSMLKSSPYIIKTVIAIYTEVYFVPLSEKTELYPVLRDWLFLNGFKIEKKFFYWKDAGNVLFVKESIR